MIDALSGVLSSFGSTLNPLDVTGAVIRDPSLLERVLPVVADSPEVGLVAVNLPVPVSDGQVPLTGMLDAIGRSAAQMKKPLVFVQTTGKSLTDLTRKAIAAHQLPHIVCGIDSLLRAVGRAVWWSGQLAHSPAPLLLALPRLEERPALDTERAVLDYLDQRSIPVVPAVVARTRAEAEAVPGDGPFAMKILSPDIAHKTEVGGVRLGVLREALGTSFDSMLAAVEKAAPAARIEGVILSPMRSGGVELLVGITRDSTWGPTITIGSGGILVELMADVAIAPLPVTPGQVRDMLRTLRGFRLLEGFRSTPPADLDRLSAVIARIGGEALGLGADLESLEINPLLVRGADVEALDGLVSWKDSK